MMLRMTIDIREQHEHEWDAVVSLIHAAFAPPRNAEALARQIRESDTWIPELSFVAVDRSGAAIIGQVLFSRVTLRTPDGAVDVLTLTPLSVAAPHRGSGIARRLVEHGLAACASRSEPLVVLEGDPAMYVRLGFRPATEVGIERPSELIPESAFQVVTLPSYAPGLRGRVEYPAYFHEVDAVGP